MHIVIVQHFFSFIYVFAKFVKRLFDDKITKIVEFNYVIIK